MNQRALVPAALTGVAVPILWGADCVSEIARHPPHHIQSLKEVGRQFLHSTGLYGLLHLKQSLQGFHTREHLHSDVAESFVTAYRIGGWVHDALQESASGIGSSTAVTAGLVDLIAAVMQHLGCRSLVDVGCGDWNWFRQTPFPFEYTGIDIVSNVIARNQQFAGPSTYFAVINAISEPLPSADIALCREVLFHLSFSHARDVVAHIKSAARYLIATTDLDLWFNSDIQSGDFRRINLCRRPYGFPPPIALISDSRLVSARRLGVWETASLPG